MGSGLYKTAFSNEGMTPEQTNRHWKREQDNHLINSGAMALIKRDPLASLGYQIRSDNPDGSLEMGSNQDPETTGNYGLYNFQQGFNTGTRRDGTLDVSVNQSPERYAQTLAHELGHVGSRNSQRDQEIMKGGGKPEEIRQRVVDYVNNPPGSPMHQDALLMLLHLGVKRDELERKAKAARAKLGIPEPPAKKKQPLKVAATPTAYPDAPSWDIESGQD